MEEVITQLENIDLDEEILITLESFSEYNIFENDEIVVPDSLFENEGLEDSTPLFGSEPVTNLPELLFIYETTVTASTKIVCNKCGKILQKTDIHRKHERMCGKLKFSVIKNN